MAFTIVISRRTGQTRGERALVAELAAQATVAGYTTLTLPDLYHIPEDSIIWQQLRALQSEVIICGWLQPRALQWLLHRHGIIVPPTSVLTLAAHADAATVLAALPQQTQTQGEAKELQAHTEERWYPVVDLSRCANCRHCLQFCLFGVYSLDDKGHVRVANPDNCKAGCPACARICPTSAIIFPLYDQDPGIAGAPGCFVVRDAAARRMYYARTEQVCPMCRTMTDAELSATSADGCCPECGRELPGQVEPSEVLMEIDALIDRLDNMTGRNQ